MVDRLSVLFLNSVGDDGTAGAWPCECGSCGREEAGERFSLDIFSLIVDGAVSRGSEERSPAVLLRFAGGGADPSAGRFLHDR